MKPYLLFLVLLMHSHPKPKDIVYYCDSPNAKIYHLKNDCHGLSRCTHRIVDITLNEAKKKKLELCKFEK